MPGAMFLFIVLHPLFLIIVCWPIRRYDIVPRSLCQGPHEAESRLVFFAQVHVLEAQFIVALSRSLENCLTCNTSDVTTYKKHFEHFARGGVRSYYIFPSPLPTLRFLFPFSRI